MKKFISKFLKNKFVLAAVLLTASVGVAGAVTLAGFGPDRPTKPYVQGMKGFDHVTFNSFTGVPNVGDERNFMTGKIAGAAPGYYDPMNQVRDGNELIMRVYIHNNADESLNESGKGVAKNTRVRVELPQGNLAKAHQAKGFISADNAQPKQIYDTLDVNANYPFEFDYVEGSAHMDSNFVNDLPLSDELIRGGVLIGDDKLDGQMKGCFEYTAVVTYKVKVKAPNYEMHKSVRLEGEDSTKWREHASVAPGKNMEWMLEFKNTGKTKLNEVVIFDQLPKGLSLVPGTTKIYNVSNPSGVDAGTDAVVGNGIKVGNYFPNSNVRVIFKAKAPEVKDLKCGTQKFVNTGYAKPHDQGAVKDEASVDVTKECKEIEQKPMYSCDLLKAEKGANRTVNYTVNASASNGAVIKNYTFDFGDGETLTTDKSTVSHTYKADGRYTTRVKVNVGVGNETKVAEGPQCAAVIEFTPTPETPGKPGQPTQLPETGAGDVAAIVAAVTAIATGAYYAVVRRVSL